MVMLPKVHTNQTRNSLKKINDTDNWITREHNYRIYLFSELLFLSIQCSVDD